jgi:hypothetical protein
LIKEVDLKKSTKEGTEMDEEIVKQIVDELLSSLEPIETQSVAILQFLKAKGIASDEELAPFLDQAGNASNVRWRAVRVRTAALISNAMKPTEQPAQTEPAQKARDQHPAETGKEPETNESIQKKEDLQKKKSEPAPHPAQPGEDSSFEKSRAAKPESNNNEDQNDSKVAKLNAAPEQARQGNENVKQVTKENAA